MFDCNTLFVHLDKLYCPARKTIVQGNRLYGLISEKEYKKALKNSIEYIQIKKNGCAYIKLANENEIAKYPKRWE